MSKPDPSYVNPRGIPQAPFIDDVGEYVKSIDQVDPTLNKFQEMLQKYKYMEMSTSQKVEALREKIPDIEKTLSMITFLHQRYLDEEDGDVLEVDYELNDTLYSKAQIERTNKVSLWLGANVMLEYTTEEAMELVDAKLKVAKNSLQTCEEDLEFLRENITIVEVNIARTYNWRVQKRVSEAKQAS